MNKEEAIDGGFLQSNHWKKFQEEVGRKTKMVELSEDWKILMVFHELPIVGGYFFIPRGPLINFSNKSQDQNSEIQKGLAEMINSAKKAGVGWVRVEPQSEVDLQRMKKVIGSEFRVVKSKKNHEPSQTLMVDLTESEDEILASMKSKTRYNIRLAEKRGVEIFESRDEKYVKKFIDLTNETAKRDGITPHPKEYYQKMTRVIPGNVLKLYFAKYEGKIISAVIVSFFGGVATYLHGASSDEHRNVMAPFTLQWKAMKEAKQSGCKKYDLGGTKLKNQKSNIKNQNGADEKGVWAPEEGNWQGISKFKQGFCPKCQPVEFPGSWDIVLDEKKYKLYGFLQNVKDFIRNIRK